MPKMWQELFRPHKKWGEGKNPSSPFSDLFSLVPFFAQPKCEKALYSPVSFSSCGNACIMIMNLIFDSIEYMYVSAAENLCYAIYY